MWQRGVVKEAELLQQYVLTHTVSHICLGNAKRLLVAVLHVHRNCLYLCVESLQFRELKHLFLS